MPITLADVARQSGVSVKTVSRVINNEAPVADETRARVLAVVEALGYTPNQSARRLARGQSGLVGLCMYDATPAYLMDVINGLMDVGDSLGLGLTLYRVNVRDDHEVDHVIAQASQRQVEGMIFTPPCEDAPRLIDALYSMHFPFVQLTPHERCSKFAWVAATDEAGSYQAARYLLDLGHTRIAFIQGNRDHQASWDRLRGYQRALREAGIPEDPAYTKQGSWTFESGLGQAQSLLHLPTPPTAIMAGNDEAAAGILQALWERGWRCPDDVSVIGFDDVPLSRQVTPPLTTVKQPIYDIARRAMSLLGALIEGESGATTVEVPTELVIRASTARPPSNAR